MALQELERLDFQTFRILYRQMPFPLREALRKDHSLLALNQFVFDNVTILYDSINSPSTLTRPLRAKGVLSDHDNIASRGGNELQTVINLVNAVSDNKTVVTFLKVLRQEEPATWSQLEERMPQRLKKILYRS